jgi:tRNA pseudouridine32 synthase/23S rRNA pseudouridine746 synthase
MKPVPNEPVTAGGNTKLSAEGYFHPFKQSTDGISLPSAFTYPFHYTPHPLTRLAAEEVQAYLRTRTDWEAELQEGKMFGVLIVRTSKQELGYLAAFSGNLAGSNQHAFFVPPVYDLLQPDGFFRIEETKISAINHRIENALHSNTYSALKEQLHTYQETVNNQLRTAKENLKRAKQEREAMRSRGTTPEEEARMIRESQFQKAEYKRLERKLKEELNIRQTALNTYETAISALKQERKQRSAALQQRLFEQFRMLNARGEVKDLCELFRNTPQGTPPAGTGECALPKLLQFAYLHKLKPLAMGEFWWGKSPKNEIRQQGHFYPSCTGKCAPILKHMLIGLQVEKNPLEEDLHRDTPLPVLYEDEWLVVVCKPAGMLSVPGKNGLDSVSERLHTLYPEATGPLIVHRLDMATSGLLLAAKTKEVHQHLQAQFETRSIRKRYTAILEGTPSQKEGIINLPLCPNLLHRPLQSVDFEHGKPAVTRYQVLKSLENRTLISFYPQTGRTHQLRVHAAHPLGLGCPIVGDELYGKKADRLYLHAAELTFTHPVNGKIIHVEQEADFNL